MGSIIYIDYQATTPLALELFAAMSPYMRDQLPIPIVRIGSAGWRLLALRWRGARCLSFWAARGGLSLPPARPRRSIWGWLVALKRCGTVIMIVQKLLRTIPNMPSFEQQCWHWKRRGLGLGCYRLGPMAFFV